MNTIESLPNEILLNIAVYDSNILNIVEIDDVNNKINFIKNNHTLNNFEELFSNTIEIIQLELIKANIKFINLIKFPTEYINTIKNQYNFINYMIDIYNNTVDNDFDDTSDNDDYLLDDDFFPVYFGPIDDNLDNSETYDINYFHNLIHNFIVKQKPEILKYIKNHSLELQILIFKNCPNYIRNIDNLNINYFKHKIIQDPFNIKYFKNKELQKLAFSLNRHVYNDIIDPSEEIQLEILDYIPDIFKHKYITNDNVKRKAVEKNPYNIQNMYHASEELQVRAVELNPYVYPYIKNKCDKALEKVYEVCKYTTYINTHNMFACQYDNDLIDTLTEEQIKSAIDLNPNIFREIKNPNYNVQKFAVQRWHFNIRHITKQTEELQLIAINLNVGTFKFLRNPTENVKELVVSLNPHIIEEIYNPSEIIKNIARNSKIQSIISCLNYVYNSDDNSDFSALNDSDDSDDSDFSDDSNELDDSSMVNGLLL